MNELAIIRIGREMHTQFFRLVDEVIRTFCRVVEELPLAFGRSLHVISFQSQPQSQSHSYLILNQFTLQLFK